MDAFTIQIAGLNARVEPIHMSTREYLKDYLVDEAAEIIVRPCLADLEFEQYMLDEEAKEEGMKLRKFTGPFLERAAIQRRVAEALLERDTILLHGSTVGLNGRAYLFTAPCGTGKSTHTRLWREVFGERAVMVNDDKPFLRITSEGVIAFGSPWCGKHGLHSNISLPLKGICVLRRGSQNLIQASCPETYFDFLMKQTLIPEDPILADKAQSLLRKLVFTVPLYEMTCNKEPEAALVSYQFMAGM